MKIWSEKYKPKRISDVIEQKRALEHTTLFIDSFKRQRRRAILLYGPPGCGKTSLIYAIASERDMEVLEINASDFRKKANIEAQIGTASQQMSLFGKEKIILIDEIDALSGTADRGGLPSLIKIIDNSKFPIILTANDPFIRKLSTLRKKTIMELMNKPEYRAIFRLLKKICDKEKIEYDDKAIEKIAFAADGDIRGAINDLQMIGADTHRIELEDIKTWEREKEESIFNAMKLVFKSFDTRSALSAIDDLKEDYNMLGLWLEQNICSEYRKPKEIRDAYSALSFADIYNSRIMKWQHWRFLVYVRAMLGAGVQQAKDTANPKRISFEKPEIITKIYMRAAKRKKLESISQQLSKKLHSSSSRIIKDFLPYLLFIKEHNNRMGSELENWLYSS